jgi:hypothetical protein
MANVKVMYELFDFVDSLIATMSDGQAEKKALLGSFFFRLLSVFDGVEGPDLHWKGIALVATEDLPDDVEEINDDFLHDAWSSRRPSDSTIDA